MYILEQTGNVLVNTDHSEYFFIKEKNGELTVAVRMRDVEIELGEYQNDRAARRAMAVLAAAMMAGGTRQ